MASDGRAAAIPPRAIPMGNLRMWGNPALTEQARNSWHNMDTHYNTYEDRTQSPDPRFNAH